MKANVARTSVNGNLNLNRNLYPGCTLEGLGLLVLGVCAALVAAPRAAAQTTPVVMPQYSTLTSTDGTIQASRLPVTYEGKAYYVDLTLALTAEVSSKGAVTIEVASASAASPTLIVSSFKAGTYVAPANINGGKSTIVVSGPSPLPDGGTAWTLSLPAGSSASTYPSTAVWYVEPIAASPLAARLSAAKITSTDYSYGEGDSGTEWCRNSLLGFAQVGNALSISTFSNCLDHATPTDTITYMLQQ